MIHQYPDKKRIIFRKKILKIFIILILFYLLSILGAFNFVTKIFNYIGGPVWEAKVALDGSDSLSYLTQSKSSLREENIKLKDEISSLKISMIDVSIFKNENNKLKELLGRITKPNNFILASILVKPSSSPYDTLIIDIGDNYEVKGGFEVYINGNIPIGTISKVYRNTAQVELYSNPGRVTEGIIEDLDMNVGIIGRGGGNFEMSIPVGLDVLQGSFITLRGLDRGILAIVKEEISDKADPNKKMMLVSPINIQNQKWVEVKKN